MKHPHHDVICEWAADTSKVVQFRAASHQPWEDCQNPRAWIEHYQYRIKPEPKPDVVTHLVRDGAGIWDEYSGGFRWKEDVIRIVRDGETGKLKSAEVLK